MDNRLPMHLPLLIIPAGGVNVVASPKLPVHLFAPYESAGAWGAKLAAANALSASEACALLGVSAKSNSPLVPARVPGVARRLGRELNIPSHQIECAFFGGSLKPLRELVCPQLRLCPACVRLGYHFVLHQLQIFTRCPLHDLPLREHCPRCGELLMYNLGCSTVHGAMNCAVCHAPQLPVTRGGYPVVGVMPKQMAAPISRWLACLRYRVTNTVLFMKTGVIHEDKRNHFLGGDPIRVIKPPRLSGNLTLYQFRDGWLTQDHYANLKMCYWEHANTHWQKCHRKSQVWYRQRLRGRSIEPAPSSHILAFIYWRMTWQGCSNPYLLRRGHGLPLFGIAGWEAVQPVFDDTEAALIAFGKALNASWDDWVDCIELSGIKELNQHAWRLRAYPGAFT